MVFRSLICAPQTITSLSNKIKFHVCADPRSAVAISTRLYNFIRSIFYLLHTLFFFASYHCFPAASTLAYLSSVFSSTLSAFSLHNASPALPKPFVVLINSTVLTKCVVNSRRVPFLAAISEGASTPRRWRLFLRGRQSHPASSRA